MMSGTEDFITPLSANQRPVFDSSSVPTFWGTLKGADHVVTATGDLKGYRGPITAWFRLHLMGDQSAVSLFYGEGCDLCTDTHWANIQRREMNQFD